MTFTEIGIIAFIVEAYVQTFKPFWDKEARKPEVIKDRLAALAIGGVITVLTGVDLFAAAGVPMDFFPVLVPWAGVVMTIPVFGRGASIVHELIKVIEAYRKSREPSV